MVVPAGVVEKLAQWASGGSAPPQRVLMYPTNNCNLKCVFCYQGLKPYDYKDTMPDEKWLAITNELCEMGVNTVQISGGGEALLRGSLVMEMMALAKSHGLTGRLVTNGTAWTEEWIRRTIEVGWDNVIHSVDGSTAEVHDRMRGVPGSFVKTTKAIRRFTELKKEFGMEKPLLEFSHVLTKWNYEQSVEMVELAHSLGVSVITYEPVFVSNPFVHQIKLSRQERERYLKELVPRALELADTYRIRTNLDHVMGLGEIEKTGELKEKILFSQEKRAEMPHHHFLDVPCFEAWLWPKIEANGDVGPCSTNMLAENIKDKSFSEVWHGPPFSEFRRRIMDRDLPEGCENCVSTHLAWNREIRTALEQVLRNQESSVEESGRG